MRTKPHRLPRIPKPRHLEVKREEFDHVIDLLNERGEFVDRMRLDLDIQFKRIAELQQELDALKRRA